MPLAGVDSCKLHTKQHIFVFECMALLNEWVHVSLSILGKCMYNSRSLHLQQYKICVVPTTESGEWYQRHCIEMGQQAWHLLPKLVSTGMPLFQKYCFIEVSLEDILIIMTNRNVSSLNHVYSESVTVKYSYKGATLTLLVVTTHTVVQGKSRVMNKKISFSASVIITS